MAIEYVGSDVSVGNEISWTVTIPALSAGDLIMLCTAGNDSKSYSYPGGYTLTEEASDPGEVSTIHTRVADGSEGGTSVTVTANDYVKAVVAVGVYSGVLEVIGTEWMGDNDGLTGNNQTLLDIYYTEPEFGEPVRIDWVGHRSSSEPSGWTAPSGYTKRIEGINTGGGATYAVLADSVGTDIANFVPGETYTHNGGAGGAVASSSIVLAPAEAVAPDPDPPAPTVTVSHWDGSTEVELFASYWDGSTETDFASVEVVSASYTDLVLSMGPDHYYSLDSVNQANDLAGSTDGVVVGDITFASDGASSAGAGDIALGADETFSMTQTGEFSTLVTMAVDDWDGVNQDNGRILWMGKGDYGPTEQEYVMVHYPATDASRPYRTSVYHYSQSGGQGAGSYIEEPVAVGVERTFVATFDNTTTSGVSGAGSGYPGAVRWYVDGVLADADGFDEYAIVPELSQWPVRLFAREESDAAHLVGRIRRVAFFPRKLTEEEIQKLYTSMTLSD